MVRTNFLALLLVAGPAGLLPAQQPNSAQASAAQAQSASEAKPTSTAPTISVDARLVNIPVVVRDKKGALVQNLTKDNFILQVDSRTQTIRYFNIDKDLPLTLGLLVDVSQSQRDAIDDERSASSSFLDNMLTGPADSDKAFVVQFAHQTDLLQDVTGSRPKLQSALKQLDSPSFGNSGGSSSGSSGSDQDSSNGGYGRGRRGGGTTLYDALFLSSDEIMAKQKGRKAVVILSDGVDNGSKETLASSIEAAQRADTIVYAIYFKGREGGGYNNQSQNQGRRGGGFPGGRGGGYPGGGGGYPGGGRGGGQRPQGNESHVDGKKILARMADETGGRLFEVTKKETVADIYKEIGDELRATYRLGYSPDDKTASEGYHQIDLSLTKSSPKDLIIQTRDGYYTGN
jgi:VWFA-related protein